MKNEIILKLCAPWCSDYSSKKIFSVRNSAVMITLIFNWSEISQHEILSPSIFNY